jgi:hypothetical protein
MSNSDPTNHALSLEERELSHVPFADLTDAAQARNPDFGGAQTAPGETIDYRQLKVSVGNRPLCWRVRNLFRHAGKVLPKGMKLYRDWDVWMIAHAVSVSDQGAFATLLNSVVDAVGYEAEFNPALVATVGLQPEPAVVRNVGGSFQVAVNLGLDGSMPSTDGESLCDIGVPLVAGASVGFSTKTEMFGRLTFGVWTPKIVTTGICSCRCEWLFNRTEAPLRNSQTMFQTVLVPAGIEQLEFRCRAYALIRSVGFIPIPSRFETMWLSVSTAPIADVKMGS